MTAHRYDPYLWVHLAGLATVPFWLILCLLGLAVGYPTLPALELTLMIGVGVLPVLYMQLSRPFCVFGVLFLALKPETMTEEQRQLLTVFRRWWVRAIAPLVSLALGLIFLHLYQVAPGAYPLSPFGTWGRLGSLTVATIGLFGANLFLQVPVSVLLVLATPGRKLQTVTPYSAERINRDFCHMGFPVGRILPKVAAPLTERQASRNEKLADVALLGHTHASHDVSDNGFPSQIRKRQQVTLAPSSVEEVTSEVQNS
jgi:hypothetical protein